MKSPRDAQFIDLAAYRRYGMPKANPPVREGVDLLKLFGWLLAVGFSLSMWIVVLLAFLYWRS